MIEIVKKQIINWTFYFIIKFSTGVSSMNFASEEKSIKLNLGGASYSDFVDFIYFYSSSNRLNLEWFGWYQVEKC